MFYRSLSLVLLLPIFLQGCSITAKDESEWTVQEFYAEAKDAYDGENWEFAIEYYEKLKAYYPYGVHAEQSYLELAYAYHKWDEPESAKRELNEFIRTYPKHKALPYAYYLRALSSDQLNASIFDGWAVDPASKDMASTKEAYDDYLALLTKFPNAKYTPKARERVIQLRNRMARHEFLVAQYYFKREAYLAAANRASQVLKKYPRSVINKQALNLLEKSYRKLGMQQNADDAKRVYEFNQQPNS